MKIMALRKVRNSLYVILSNNELNGSPLSRKNRCSIFELKIIRHAKYEIRIQLMSDHIVFTDKSMHVIDSICFVLFASNDPFQNSNLFYFYLRFHSQLRHTNDRPVHDVSYAF